MEIWEAAGFTAVTARPWMERGFTPEEARLFREAGLTPEEALSWKIPSVPVPEALAWREAGFAPEEVVAWRQAGWTLEEARTWKEKGFAPDEAKIWKSSGFPNPKEASRWKHQGFEAHEVAVWKKAGFKPGKAGAMRRAGLSPEEAKRWLQWYEMDDVVALKKAGFTLEEALKWEKQGGFTGEEAAAWKRAGFTLEEARSWKKQGVEDPEEARRLRDLEKRVEAEEKRAKIPEDRGPIRAWIRAGFEAEEIQQWMDAGFNLDEAKAWRRKDFQPEEAASWKAAGFSPKEARKWWNGGFRRPGSARAWREAGFDPEEAGLWAYNGRSVEEARAWKDQGFTFETHGEWKVLNFSPEEAGPWKRAGMEPLKAREWMEVGVRTEDLSRYQRAGFLTEKMLQALKDARIPAPAALEWHKAGYDVAGPAATVRKFILLGARPSPAPDGYVQWWGLMVMLLLASWLVSGVVFFRAGFGMAFLYGLLATLVFGALLFVGLLDRYPMWLVEKPSSDGYYYRWERRPDGREVLVRSLAPPGEVIAQSLLIQITRARYVARVFARMFGAFPPKTARFFVRGFLGLCTLVFVLYFIPYDLILAASGDVQSSGGIFTGPWGIMRFDISAEGEPVRQLLLWMLGGVGAWFVAVFLPIVVFARDDLMPTVPNPEATASEQKAA